MQQFAIPSQATSSIFSLDLCAQFNIMLMYTVIVIVISLSLVIIITCIIGYRTSAAKRNDTLASQTPSITEAATTLPTKTLASQPTLSELNYQHTNRTDDGNETDDETAMAKRKKFYQIVYHEPHDTRPTSQPQPEHQHNKSQRQQDQVDDTRIVLEKDPSVLEMHQYLEHRVPTAPPPPELPQNDDGFTFDDSEFDHYLETIAEEEGAVGGYTKNNNIVLALPQQQPPPPYTELADKKPEAPTIYPKIQD